MSNVKKKGSSVERVLQIVEVLARSSKPMGVIDLAETLDIPVPSMYRLLNQLQPLQFVQLDLHGKVTCGKRTHDLALDLWKNSPFKAERLAILQQLSAKIGESVGIAVLQDLEVVYIDRVISDWPVQIQLPTGTNVPVWACASGKLLLTQLTDNKCERIVEKLSLQALTTHTQTDKKQLMTSIAEVRKTQIGTDNEEFIPGMVACAVPIPNGDQPAFATVFTHGPTVRKSLDELLSHVPVMQEAANELSVIFNQEYDA